MSETKCIIETIDNANQVGSVAWPAIETIRSATIPEEASAPAISCEQCGATFAISTELGDDRAQLKLAGEPFEESEACTTALNRKVGDWSGNLSNRWFKLELLGSQSSDDYKSSPDDTLEISARGLEIALSDAASNLRQANQLEIATNKFAINQLKRSSTATASILDLVLPRSDGKTWQDEINARVT